MTPTGMQHALEELRRRGEELEADRYRPAMAQLAETQNKLERLQNILVFSESHPLRVVLAVTETITAVKALWGSSMFSSIAGPLGTSPRTWAILMAITAVLQFHFLLRGQYSRRDTLVFGAWDSLWWVFIASTMIEQNLPIPAPQIGIMLAAAWVFVSSGIKAYGRRGTDYAD